MCKLIVGRWVSQSEEFYFLFPSNTCVYVSAFEAKIFIGHFHSNGNCPIKNFALKPQFYNFGLKNYKSFHLGRKNLKCWATHDSKNSQVFLKIWLEKIRSLFKILLEKIISLFQNHIRKNQKCSWKSDLKIVQVFSKWHPKKSEVFLKKWPEKQQVFWENLCRKFSQVLSTCWKINKFFQNNTRKIRSVFWKVTWKSNKFFEKTCAEKILDFFPKSG